MHAVSKTGSSNWSNVGLWPLCRTLHNGHYAYCLIMDSRNFVWTVKCVISGLCCWKWHAFLCIITRTGQSRQSCRFLWTVIPRMWHNINWLDFSLTNRDFFMCSECFLTRDWRSDLLNNKITTFTSLWLCRAAWSSGTGISVFFQNAIHNRSLCIMAEFGSTSPDKIVHCMADKAPIFPF